MVAAYQAKLHTAVHRKFIHDYDVGTETDTFDAFRESRHPHAAAAILEAHEACLTPQNTDLPRFDDKNSNEPAEVSDHTTCGIVKSCRRAFARRVHDPEHGATAIVLVEAAGRNCCLGLSRWECGMLVPDARLTPSRLNWVYDCVVLYSASDGSWSDSESADF